MLGPGDSVPDIALSDLTGNAVSTATAAQEGPVLLAFFKITCPTCQLTLPFLNHVHRAGNIRVIGVAQDDASSAKGFIDRFGLLFPVWIDDIPANYPASNAFGITHVPTLFLLQPDGKIGWTSNGFHKGDLEDLGRLAGAVLFGPGDRVPQWKPG